MLLLRLYLNKETTQLLLENFYGDVDDFPEEKIKFF